MPRQARKKSALNINHIILRGVNQQIIFEDEYDYQQFISILRYYKDICNFRVYAYCLMNNHIHLLIGHTKYRARHDNAENRSKICQMVQPEVSTHRKSVSGSI